MKITHQQREGLSEMIHFALIEIRALLGRRKVTQAADLADAFHKVPRDMWNDDFNLENFRDAFLKPYQEKYQENRAKNYVALINLILNDVAGDHSKN